MVFPWFSHGFPMVFPWFPQVARRVAAERGEALGGSVGYAVRFDAVRGPGGRQTVNYGMVIDITLMVNDC